MTLPVSAVPAERQPALTPPPPPAESASGEAEPDVPRRWRRIVMTAAGLWLATRLGYALFTYIAVALTSPSPGHIKPLLEAWDQYDTHWYLLISRLDYTQLPMSAFFPLYPALVGQIATFLGHAQGPVWPAFDGVRLLIALGVANAFSLVGFVGVALLAAHESDDDGAASRALWALAAYPFAFFLAAAYTEGPFLAAAAFTLYFARRGSWRWAFSTALIAGFMRPTAVALVLPLAWEYGRQHDWGRPLLSSGWAERLRVLAGAVAVVAPVPLAFGAYAVFLWQRFGSPLVWFQAQTSFWHRETTPPWRTAISLGHRLLNYPAWSRDQAMLLLALLPLLLFGFVVIVSIRKMPFAFVLYTLAVCYLAISAPVFSQPDLIESTGRLLLAAVPVFLVIGGWMRAIPAFAQLWVVGGLMLQGLLLTNFFAGHWIA